MSYKSLASVHLAPVFCTGLIYNDCLNKPISFQNIHSNCLVHRQLLFIDNRNMAFQSWMSSTLILCYSALSMVSKTSFAKRGDTKGQTEI